MMLATRQERYFHSGSEEKERPGSKSGSDEVTDKKQWRCFTLLVSFADDYEADVVEEVL